MGIFFYLFLNTFIVKGNSSDYNWEKRISIGVAEKAKVTELLWLETINNSFLALFNSLNSEETKSAVIILHSIGGHADWPEVISPLRKMLPKFGWATLSIQLPLLSPESTIQEYGSTFQETQHRIIAAVKLLRKRGFSKVVLIGHGFGALSSLVYLEKENSQNIDAMIAISLQGYVYIKPSINILRLIEKIKIPMLDIYGSLDFKEGVESAPDRRLASKKSGNYLYTQIEVKNADHYFNNMENDLIKNIVDWLKKTY